MFLRTLAMLIALGLLVGSVSRAMTTSPPTITLEKAVHFIARSGDDVLVEAGTYEVEGAETWIRLIPEGKERAEAVLLAARRGPHGMEVATPEVRSIQAGEDEEYVWLLLPDGQSWLAKGSYSGVRTRSTSPPETSSLLEYGVEYIGPNAAYDSRTAYVSRGLEPDNVSLGFCQSYAEVRIGSNAVAWTWYPETGRCVIFATYARFTETRPKISAVSGKHVPQLYPYGVDSYSGEYYPLAYIFPYHNFFYPNGGYRNFQNTLGNCQKECARDHQRCRVFSWNKTTNVCYLRDYTAGQGNHSLDYISGINGTNLGGEPIIIGEEGAKYTKKNLPICIQLVLQGQTVQLVSGIFGRSWYCYPAQFLSVHSPDFRSKVVAALYRGIRGGEEENAWFNKLFSDMNLASSPPNAQFMFGYISRPIDNAKNDVAYFTVSLSRISADETQIHATRVTFSSGGYLNTPILGDLIRIAISQAVSYLTGGIPFSGTLAVMAIEHIASEGSSGTEDAANRIIGAIALSANPVLPLAASEVIPAVLLPLY